MAANNIVVPIYNKPFMPATFFSVNKSNSGVYILNTATINYKAVNNAISSPPSSPKRGCTFLMMGV